MQLVQQELFLNLKEGVESTGVRDMVEGGVIIELLMQEELNVILIHLLQLQALIRREDIREYGDVVGEDVAE